MSKILSEIFQGKSSISSEHLEQNIDLFQEVINNLPSLVCIKNVKGEYTLVNHAFTDLAAISRKDILGKNDEEVGLFLNPDQIMEADMQVFKTGQKKHIPLEPFTDKFGNLFWFTTTKIPIKNDKDEVVAISIVSSNVTTKIATEQQLKKSEQRYKSIFEDNYSGIIVVDKDLNILNKNKSFNFLVKDTRPNVLSIDDLKKYVNDEDAKDLRDLLNGVISRNYEYFDLSLQLIPADGSTKVDTNCYVRGLYNQSGTFTEAVVTFQDITEDLRTRRELEESEQRFRLMIEHAPEGVLLYDCETLFYIDANEKALDIYGLDLDSIKQRKRGESTPDLLPDGQESAKVEKESHEKALKGENVTYEWVIRNQKSNELIPVEVKLNTLMYNNRQVMRMSIIDISKQKKDQLLLEEQQHKIQESELRFRTIVENATEALLLLDYDTKCYIDANQNAVELFGYTLDEFKKIALGELSPINQATGENSSEKSRTFMERALKGERVVYEWIVRRKNGKLVPCEVRLVKLPYQNKNIIRTSVIDITDRKKAEHLLNLEKQKLQDSNSELVDANVKLEDQTKQLQEFAYIASHNLRSPAGNIKALIDFYNNDPTQENLSLMLEKLDVVSDDLMDTIQDLAKVVQIKNELSKEQEKIHLNKVLEKTEESLSQTIINLNAKISSNLDSNSFVYAPKTYIDSIFLNFISNSLKYSRDDVPPIIEVIYKEEEKNVTLIFKDNGLGIDLNKHRLKLFGLRKTFHRNKDSRGVGLFITKAQIESLGGTIDVESTVGEGTTFTITFPKTILSR